MAHEYTVNAGGITVAGATTLVFINPKAAPDVNLEFLRMWIGQTANATSAQQRMQAETQASVFPTLTGATPAPMKQAEQISRIVSGTAGAAGTAGTNASAEGAGTKTAIFNDAFNVLNGYLWVPTPRETIIMPAGFTQGIGLFLPIAPTTLTNWTAGMNFGEV